MLYQVSTLAHGKSWDEKKSPAQNYTSSFIGSSNYSSSSSYTNSSNSYQSSSYNSYQGEYQNFNSPEFKNQTEAFFNKKQMENSTRRE